LFVKISAGQRVLFFISIEGGLGLVPPYQLGRV